MLEIADFLSQEECSHLIQLALDEGLQSSITHKQEEDNDFKGHIKIMDLDNNKKLTISEVGFLLAPSLKSGATYRLYIVSVYLLVDSNWSPPPTPTK